MFDFHAPQDRNPPAGAPETALPAAPASGIAASGIATSGGGAPLRRPRILLRAARAGLADYERGRELRRLLRGAVPSPRRAARLLGEE